MPALVKLMKAKNSTRTLEAAFEMGCGIDNLKGRDALSAELAAALASGDAQSLAEELMAFSVRAGEMLQEVQLELVAG